MHSKSVTSINIILIIFLTISLNANNNKLFGQSGPEYLAFADEMPEPVGGMPAIYEHIQYPKMALEANVEGKVYVLAFINEEGGVDDVKLVKGIGAGCDEACINAVKKVKFVPGKSAGKIAKIKMSLQIQFKLH